MMVYQNEYPVNMNDEEEYEHHLYGIVNNGGYNLNRPGNQGRYTYSRIITNIDDWDAVFDHLRLPPIAYETSGYIYDNSFGRAQEDLNIEAFPLVDMIPLPSSTPGFRRCIFHIEEVENHGNQQHPNYQLTGRCIPIPVSYHVNHPIAQAIMRVFHFDAPQYQTNETTMFMTLPNDNCIRQLAAYLSEQGNNFEAFAEVIPALILGPGSNILPDPEVVRRANQTIVFPDYDVDPTGSQEAYEQWRAIVYPDFTEEQRRVAYEEYATEQINIHRSLRIKWGHHYPERANPYELPLEDDERENNPVDRIPADNNPANVYIQQLYNAQNNEQRGRIAAIDVR